MWAARLSRLGVRGAPVTRSFSAKPPLPPTPAPASSAAGVPKVEIPQVTGAKARRPDGSSHEKAQSPWMIRIGYAAAGVAIGSALFELARPHSAVDNVVRSKDHGIDLKQDDNGIGAMWHRLSSRVSLLFNFFNNPISDKLLPDLLPAPYQRPYTLVLDLDETLVHSEWSRDQGWVIRRRPGVDYFLAYLSNFYEIVIFSQQAPFYAEPIISKLDPQGYVMYRLYKESTQYEDGAHIKDLSRLNRDLGRVVVVEDDAAVLRKQPENLIVAKKWTDDQYDDWLMQLIPFLETLARTGTNDVRPILQQYAGMDVVEAFAENQRRYAMQKQQLEQQQRASAGSKGRTTLGSLFGGNAQEVSLADQQAQAHQQFQEQQKREAEAAARAQAEKELAEMEAKKGADAGQETAPSGWFGGWFGGSK